MDTLATPTVTVLEPLPANVSTALAHVSTILGTDSVSLVRLHMAALEVSVEVEVDGAHLMVHQWDDQPTVYLLTECTACGQHAHPSALVTDAMSLATARYHARRTAPRGIARLLEDLRGCRH